MEATGLGSMTTRLNRPIRSDEEETTARLTGGAIVVLLLLFFFLIVCFCYFSTRHLTVKHTHAHGSGKDGAEGQQKGHQTGCDVIVGIKVSKLFGEGIANHGT